MNVALARARADLEAGRPWKARDRLLGVLANRQDPEVLDLLATVHYEMRDLPAAGALWFVTGRDDDPARRAIAAWRERFGNDESRWQSIPSRIRETLVESRVRELRKAAGRAAHARWKRQRVEQRGLQQPSWPDRLADAAFVIFLIWVAVMTVIGASTVLVWIWR